MIFPMENNGDLPAPSTMTSQETTPEVVQRLIRGLKHNETCGSGHQNKINQ